MNPRLSRIAANLTLCVVGGLAGLAVGHGWAWLQSRAERNGTSAMNGALSPQSGSASAPSETGPSAAEGPGKVGQGPPNSDRWSDLAAKISAGPRMERWLLLMAAAESAELHEFPELLEICSGDSAARNMIATRWTERNPASFWKALLAAPRSPGGRVFGSDFSTLCGVLVHGWFTKDPEAVLLAMDQAAHVSGIRSVRVGVLDRLIRLDPVRSLAWIERWQSSRNFPDLGPLREWASRDPVAASALLRKHPGLTAVAEEVGAGWARTDPAAAIQWAHSHCQGEQRRAMAGAAIQVWAEKSPVDAAVFLSGIADLTLRSALSLPLLKTWSGEDPAAALQWAEANLKGAAGTEAVGQVVGELARRDPNAAAALVAGMEPGGALNAAAGKLALQWFLRDGPTPMVEWLRGLDDMETRDAAFQHVQGQWVGKDPESAAAFAAGPDRDLLPASFTSQVALARARQDPLRTMEWVNQLPEDRQSEVRSMVLSEWVGTRPEAAAAWVVSQPPGPEREKLLGVAARYLVWRAPGSVDVFLTKLNQADRPVVHRALGQIVGSDPQFQTLLRKLED